MIWHFMLKMFNLPTLSEFYLMHDALCKCFSVFIKELGSSCIASSNSLVSERSCFIIAQFVLIMLTSGHYMKCLEGLARFCKTK
jgi:hypothetical protein